MNLDFSVGREFSHGFFVQGSYVGRLSRHSLLRRDLAEPTDMVDPKSGQTYYQAMDQLMTLMDFQGVSYQNLPKIPFFEDMWAGAAGNGLTATQVWGNDYHNNSQQGDATHTQNNPDNAANCSTKGTVFKSSGAVSRRCPAASTVRG